MPRNPRRYGRPSGPNLLTYLAVGGAGYYAAYQGFLGAQLQAVAKRVMDSLQAHT